jgi:hypothetical protein
MNRGTNIALLIAAGIFAVASERWFFSGPRLFAEPSIVDAVPSAVSASREAEVISVESGSTDRTPTAGRALVRLLSGERVQALVPSGCGVLPGQTTRVAKRAIGSDTSYVVIENGK